jgi:hypothetical protein
MTVTEFSNEFDIAYNSVATNAAPGIDLYEKSVFLTKAQDELVKNYFNPKGNKYQEGFDQNQKRQIDFLNLVKVTELTLSGDNIINTTIKLDQRSKLFSIPNDILFITNESVNGSITSVDSGNGRVHSISKIINVIAINFQEYSKFMLAPYKLPYKNQGWRLINNAGPSHVFELIVDPNLVVTSYVLKYIKKPSPIILTDLVSEFSGEGLTIEGQTAAQTCELDVIVHQEILQRAVELAKSFYQGNANSIVELGKRSE